MSWWGTVIGGAFGFLVGGPLGALLGAALGRNFDQGLNKLGRNARDFHGTCHEPWPSRQHHGEDPALATGGKPCADCSAVWGWH